jgi:hypothetical protein
MSGYTSAVSFLADLRLDAFGPEVGVLVVEGPDDKRVFIRHVSSFSQLVPAGGRTLLLAAHEASSAEDRRRMVFLTDCDYEVRFGNLHPADSLVITEKTDLECDLIDLGLLYRVVLEILPAALGSETRAAQIVESTLTAAESFALPLGRIRMAAKPLGIPLHLEEIKHEKHWNVSARRADADKLARTAYARLREAGIGISEQEWRILVAETPDDPDMCQGKDLINAIHFWLRREHSLPSDVKPVTICRLLRTSLWRTDLSAWSVGRRIQKWESATGRRSLS